MIEANGQQLPLGWVQVPLSDVLLPTTTTNPTTAKEGTFLYVDIEAVDNQRQRVSAPRRIENALAPSRARNALRSGDVIFSLVRPYLKNIAIIPPELDSAVASTAFFVCRPGQGIDSRFLINFLRREVFIASITTYGSSPPAARDEEFERLTVLVPPSAEQSRIADALDELCSDLDAGVTALEGVREKLKLYRASVLKAAVEGRLTAEWRAQHPHMEPASELLKRILVERRRHWEEDQLAKFKAKGQEPPKNWKAKYKEPVAPNTTNLPPLPEGWCWAAWPQIGFSQNGRPFPSSDYQDSGTKLLRPGNLYPNGAVGWTERNTRFMPERYAAESPDLIVGGGELVVNLTAQSLRDDFLGRVCITSESERCLLNQRLARLTPVIVLPKFLLWLFKAAHFRQFVAGLNTGSLIQHMFTSQLDDFVLPLPPFSEQEAIAEAVEDQLSVIDHLEANLAAKLKNSHALRQSILHNAFTGQLVPQDPNDEPASELLKRVAAERAAHTCEAAAAKRANEKTCGPGNGRHRRSKKSKAKDD
jgi:type I restriction enzyme S subunit